MAIKTVIAKLDDVDESLRGLYRESENGFILDIEGVDEHPDVKGMKVVMEDQKKKTKAEQAKTKEVQKALDAFQDLDPEAAREALTKIQELEDKGRMDKGEFEQLLAERITEATGKVERAMNAQLTEAKTQNEASALERDAAINTLSKFKISDEISQAALEAGVKKTLLRHLTRDAHEVFEVRESKVGAWDADDILRTDEKGGQLTPKTYVRDYLVANPDFSEPNRGAGYEGSGGPGSSGAVRFVTSEQAGDHLEAIASGEAVIQD